MDLHQFLRARLPYQVPGGQTGSPAEADKWLLKANLKLARGDLREAVRDLETGGKAGSWLAAFNASEYWYSGVVPPTNSPAYDKAFEMMLLGSEIAARTSKNCEQAARLFPTLFNNFVALYSNQQIPIERFEEAVPLLLRYKKGEISLQLPPEPRDACKICACNGLAMYYYDKLDREKAASNYRKIDTLYKAHSPDAFKAYAFVRQTHEQSQANLRNMIATPQERFLATMEALAKGPTKAIPPTISEGGVLCSQPSVAPVFQSGADAIATRPCANCSKEVLSSKGRCGGCSAVWYCGRDCQIAHRPKHKAFCKEQAARLAAQKAATGS